MTPSLTEFKMLLDNVLGTYVILEAVLSRAKSWTWLCQWVPSNTGYCMTVISSEKWSSALDKMSFLLTALARDASLVCCCLPCQREEWSYHVCFVWHWDSKRNWNQQSSPSPKTPISNPGDGVTDKSISTSNIQNSESCLANFFFPTSPYRSLQKNFCSTRVALYHTLHNQWELYNKDSELPVHDVLDCWLLIFFFYQIFFFFFLSHCFDYPWCYPNQYGASYL